MKTVYFIIFLFFSIQLTAEEYVTLSLNYLALKADRIVEATWIRQDSIYHIFISRDVVGNNIGKMDTIVLNETHGDYTYSKVMRKSERVLLFLKNYNYGYGLVHSGYRILANNTIFQPVQPDWSFPFKPSPIREQIDWIELIKRVKVIHEKIVLLLNLKSINDPVKRNKALFDWVEQNHHSFSKYYSTNSVQGHLDSEVLTWISEVGNMNDTWRAAILMNDIFDRFSYDKGIPSFCSVEGRKFLLDKIQSDDLDYEKKRIALHLLGLDKSLWDSYREKASIINKEEQQNLLKELKPLLKVDSLQLQALKTIKYISGDVSLQLSGNQERILNLELLPYLIRLYKKSLPSEFRNRLAELIVPHIGEEEWNKLSGNEYHVLIFLYNLKIDTEQEKLLFAINYNFGELQLTDRSFVMLEKIEKGRTIEEKTIAITNRNSNNFSQPFKCCSVASLEISTTDLSSGTWRVYLIGQIDERTWRSESLIFQL